MKLRTIRRRKAGRATPGRMAPRRSFKDGPWLLMMRQDGDWIRVAAHQTPPAPQPDVIKTGAVT